MGFEFYFDSGSLINKKKEVLKMLSKSMLSKQVVKEPVRGDHYHLIKEGLHYHKAACY